MIDLRKALLLRGLPVLLVALLMLILWWILRLLGMPDSLAPAALEAWLTSRGGWGVILLILLMVLAVVVGPIPTLPVTAASGLAFGIPGGILVAVTGAALGAMIAFQVSRFLGRDYMRRRLVDNPLFHEQAPQRILFRGVLLTRLVPLFSFALVSYAAGLTAISHGRFLVATVVGMLPMTVVFAGLGQGFRIDPLYSGVAAVLLLCVMLVGPYYLRRFHGKRISRWLDDP